MAKEQSKRGRPRVIQSPDELLAMWEQYKQWTLENPIRVQDFVGKDGDEVYRLKQRPLTQQRFETFCADKYGVTVHQYFDNAGGSYNDFLAVCSRIVKERQADQIEGGMAGIYNPSITQRLNGLTEQVKQDGKTEIIIRDETK